MGTSSPLLGEPYSPESVDFRVERPIRKTWRRLFQTRTTIWISGIIALTLIFLLLFRSALNPSDLLASKHLPLIVYGKPRKTGSTVASSMLGNAVLRAGGKIAPCKVASLMTRGAKFYGLVRGYDLLGCHTDMTTVSVDALSRLRRDVIFVTSTREPVSWFLSASVWVYERKYRQVADSKERFHAAIDEALDGGEEFADFRARFLRDNGIDVNATEVEIEEACNIYTYVFDHESMEADVNEALAEMGYSRTRPSSLREGMYDHEWFEGYREADIKKATELEAQLYSQLRAARNARRKREAPWASGERDDARKIYSALGKRTKVKDRKAQQDR